VTEVPNLASRPFRNERLPAALFAAAALLLAVFTARHALALVRLPARSSALHEEVSGLEAEASRLRQEAGRLQMPAPDKATVAHWTLLKDLVDRRDFSWTRLLAGLEAVLPEGVRIVAIDPSLRKGEMRIDLVAVSRSFEDSLALVRALEASEDFDDVYPVSDQGAEGGEARYTMRYRPSARPAAAAEAEAGAPEQSRPGETEEG
jgi:Tfp pilus assembly protein PilN